jgi:RNA polymerase sigma factor (TIGR02999 family)
MKEVTEILHALEQGQAAAAGRLLPLVYDELRKLAGQRLAAEPAGHTLQATDLVHEAYLRLVDVEQAQRWNSRGHFFGAAAEAMRRILVERARHKAALKAGGNYRRVSLDRIDPSNVERPQDLLALDEALQTLECHHAKAAELVKLRFFAGMSHQEAAAALGISRRTADGLWTLARAWLYRQLAEE